MSEKARKRRVDLWLIGAVCAAPVIASYAAFYFAPPTGHANYGELMPVRPLFQAGLHLADGRAFQLSQLKGRWVLMMVDSGRCEEFCRRKLFTLRQLRLAQGKDAERIERAWLISDDAVPPAAAVREYHGTWLIRAAGSRLLSELPAERSPAEHVYLMDPLGNLVMRYPREADPSGMIKDLVRLLKASRIG